MAVSAKFIADFTQFTAAVDKAEVKFREFQSGAGSVEKALTRVGDAFSGRKILQEATLAAKAVEDIGGVTKLTASEQQRLNGIVTEALEKYKALGQEAPQNLVAIEEATRSAGSATEAFKEHWVAFTVAVGAAVIAVRQVVSEAQEWLTAAGQQEDALVRVNTALTAQGTATPQVIDQYAALATQFQNTTVFADELISEMQALLIQVGDVMPGEMEGALTAATNLAAGLRIDLRTATMLVGKAFEGETGTLKRYGIVIDEAKLKAGGAAVVLEAINEKFGGQATAQAETYTGQIAQMGNKFNEMQEKLGDLLSRAILPLLEKFEALSPATQEVILGAIAVAAVVGPLAAAFLSVGAAVTLILPMLTAALPAALTALGVLMGPAGLIILGITAIVAAWRYWDEIVVIVKRVYEGVRDWFGAKLQAVFDAVKAKVAAVTGYFKQMYDAVVGKSYVPDMIEGIGVEFGRLDSVMVQPTITAATSVLAVFQSLAQQLASGMGIGAAIQNMLGGGGGGTGGLVGAGITKGLNSAFNAAAPGITSLFGLSISSALGAAIPGIGAVIGPLLTKGLGAIWGGLKNLLGGPDEAELAGRDAAAHFRAQLEGMLTDVQKLEAGNDGWKKSVIAVRDAYLEAGKTEQEALAIMDRLWKAEKQGGDAVKKVIDEITRVINSGLTPASVGFGTAISTASVIGARNLMTLGDVASDVGAHLSEIGAGIQWPEPWADWGSPPSGGGDGDGGGGGGYTSEDIADYLRRNKNLPGGRTWDDIFGPNVPQLATGTGGKYLNFGSGTPAMLHGRERVMTEAEGNAEAAGLSTVIALLEQLLSVTDRAWRDNPRALGVAIQAAKVLSR